MPTRQKVEIGSDIGESFGNYVLGQPEEVVKLINVGFVACGFHAGDPGVIHQTVKWCKQYNVTLGAHPGYPDLLGFGRRYIKITPEEGRDYVIYQVGALKNFADHVGIKIRTAKPHGGLGLWAWENEEHAKAFVDGLLTIGPDLEAVHLPGSASTPLHGAVKKAGLRIVPEIYPGLTYLADGRVVVTRKYEADAEEEARLIVKWLRTGKVDTLEGKEIELDAESIVVHGDMANSVQVIFAIKRAVEGEGVKIGPAL